MITGVTGALWGAAFACISALLTIKCDKYINIVVTNVLGGTSGTVDIGTNTVTSKGSTDRTEGL